MLVAPLTVSVALVPSLSNATWNQLPIGGAVMGCFLSTREAGRAGVDDVEPLAVVERSDPGVEPRDLAVDADRPPDVLRR